MKTAAITSIVCGDLGAAAQRAERQAPATIKREQLGFMVNWGNSYHFHSWISLGSRGMMKSSQ
jgi:hypothetical protein